MNKNTSIKKIVKNSSLFIILISLTFYTIFKNNNINEIISIINRADLKYILVGIMCMFIFIGCEGMNIRRSLKIMGYKKSFYQTLKYAFVGFFFSSVTPSASGGQPMQIYYMHKDNIKVSHSTLCLLIELASFQFVTAGIAIIGFFCKRSIIDNLGNIKYLLLVGVSINISALILILISIFSKKLIAKIIDFLCFILEKLKYKKVEAFKGMISEQVKEYESSAVYFKENKSAIIKIILTTVVQIVALHSITFWVYRAFNLNTYSLFTVICLQSVLYVTVSAIPLPGAMGVSESGFMIMYRTLFPGNILSSAMVLSRGISFYLFLLISGMVILISYLLNLRKNNYNKEIKINREAKSYGL